MRTLGTLSMILLASLLLPGSTSAQEDCENACEPCQESPEEWKNLGFGVSTYMTWMEPGNGCIGEYSCVPALECRAPGGEDAKPQEVLEAELDQLFALDRDQVLDWVETNREDFQLAVVDGTLQVANRCGVVVTWVALEPSQVARTLSLLDQD